MCATFSDSGKIPVSSEPLIIFVMIGASSLMHFLRSQVGIGSKEQEVVGEFRIILETVSTVIGENPLKELVQGSQEICGQLFTVAHYEDPL